MREALLREIQDLRLLVGSSRDPEGRVFAQLGDALRRAGDLDGALEVLRDGVERHPHFTPGYVALGWTVLETGDPDEALTTFRRALSLDPENPFSLFGAGSVLAARGEESGPILVEQALDLHPEIRSWVPRVPRSPGPLHGLPFQTLAELAPDPFMTLAELAPDPFMALAELAPDPGADPLAGLPFRPMAELAPDPPALGEPPGVEPLDVAEEAPMDAGDGDEEDGEAEDAIPVTRTMAELFARQGLTDRAVQIYEELAAASPDDDGLVHRLHELRHHTGHAGVAGERDDVGAGEGADEARDLHPALSVSAPDPVSPSPYGWHVEREEADDGPPSQTSAAAYFGRLLAWTPGNPAREADEASSPEPQRDPGAGEP